MRNFQFQLLKDYQREHRQGFPDALGLRVHRAISWMQRAEECADDDSAFIFLWVGFNAAYAQDLGSTGDDSESVRFKRFLGKLVDLDTDRQLYQHVWTSFPGAIRVLLQNKFVFQHFWQWQRGEIDADQWQQKFDVANKAAARALAGQDTAKVLSVIFDRLYVLRNQLLHGGATWQGSVNRDQLRDAVPILGAIVPTVIRIMMGNPDALWGEASYPVVTA